MCFHYVLTNKAKTQDASIYSFSKDINLLKDFNYKHVNAFGFPRMPIVTNEKPDRISFYQWGLIPYWAKDANTAKNIRAKTLNARSETIHQRPAFRSSVNQRCIVLAEGFYEWQKKDDRKIPYFICLPERELFGFAGLFSSWFNKNTGKLIKTYTILTTRANSTMATIHNNPKYSKESRMPVILKDAQFDAWLDTDDKVQNFCNPDELNLAYQALNGKIAPPI